MVKISKCTVKASQVLGASFLILVVLACAGDNLIQAALAQADKKTSGSEGSTKVVKPGEGKRKFFPVKIEENLATGTLVGQPFSLTKATFTANTIVLDGGNVSASDPSKGRTKIVIEFSTPQVFPNENYQISYNSSQALTIKSQTRAPRVTYVVLDKSGDVVTTTATNNAKADNLDYAMELRFDQTTKMGELPGYIRLQIGSNPVSDVKGFFCAKR